MKPDVRFDIEFAQRLVKQEVTDLTKVAFSDSAYPGR